MTMFFSMMIRRLLPLLLGAVLASCGGGDEAARKTPAAVASNDPADGKARALAMDPVTPFTGNGWYWNAREGGTGFMFEAQGSRAFVGFFVYEEGTGNPVWYVATGELANGEASGDYRFSGDLLVYRGGMALTAHTWTQPTSRSLGAVAIDFVGGRASVAFPGGRVMQAERFCAGGPCLTDATATPSFKAETGWYWNPAEGGRGYAIESYGASSFMGIFHYNPDGSPVWHIVAGPRGDYSQLERLDLYTGGQTLTSTYRTPTLDTVSGLLLKFERPCSGHLKVPGAPSISLRRFVIDDTRPPGAECNALATLVDVPDASRLNFDLASTSTGELVHGVIDTPDDVDGYRVWLEGYNQTFTFDLMGAASRSGTLANPRLSAYDADLALIAENDDRDATTTDSRVSITVPSPRFYYLRVGSSSVNPGNGSFVLKISGLTPGMSEARLLPVADYQGAVTGRLRGAMPAHVSLRMAADGTVSGVMNFLPPAARRVEVSGTVAPDGVLTFSGSSIATGPIRCQAAALNGGIFGGCGDAGMLTGISITRTVSAYGQINLPESTTVGQPVQMSTTALGGPFPTTATWDFGDGTVGEGVVPPPHVYAKPGRYSISVSLSSPTSGSTFAYADLMVFCTDGSLCTDLAEPTPSVTIDSADCTLWTLPPALRTNFKEQPNYSQAPLITFTGRASGSSNQRLVSFASGNRRVSEAEIRQSLRLFDYWDDQSMRLACDGRDPCAWGPFDTFSVSPANQSGTYQQLQSLWEQRPRTNPQPVWLYVLLLDYSRVLAVAERSLTCPGHVVAP